MQPDQHTSNRPTPLRSSARISQSDDIDDAGDVAERRKSRTVVSQLDPNESESGRRPTRSEENTPRYRR
jgi:hypothetical protein